MKHKFKWEKITHYKTSAKNLLKFIQDKKIEIKQSKNNKLKDRKLCTDTILKNWDINTSSVYFNWLDNKKSCLIKL